VVQSAQWRPDLGAVAQGRGSVANKHQSAYGTQLFFVQAKGKTVLYIPSRGKLPGAGQEYTEADAKDKDLVQQLESTLIHWTRQIKEVGSMHGYFQRGVWKAF
jgi:hypothetical protein